MDDADAAAAAGPSAQPTANRNDASLLRQFVMEYLQQHGFDKALNMLQQGDQGDGAEKDADGEEDAMGGAGAGGPTTRSAAGREAIFRAPGPVELDSMLKRNIPQAQSISSSTMSDKITPEFEAQAKYIIEQLQKRAVKEAEEEAVGEPPESILDPSDRADGYRRYRKWVDGGLDLWKVSIEAMDVCHMANWTA